MANWITYARPFARRRMIYRKKAEAREASYAAMPTTNPVEIEHRDGRVETARTCAEAIEYMWNDFKKAAGLQ